MLKLDSEYCRYVSESNEFFRKGDYYIFHWLDDDTRIVFDKYDNLIAINTKEFEEKFRR